MQVEEHLEVSSSANLAEPTGRKCEIDGLRSAYYTTHQVRSSPLPSSAHWLPAFACS